MLLFQNINSIWIQYGVFQVKYVSFLHPWRIRFFGLSPYWELSLKFEPYRQLKAFLGRMTSPLEGNCIQRTTRTQTKANISIIQVGFEPTIPVFSWAKIVRALDRLLSFWNIFPVDTLIHFVRGIVIVNWFRNIHVRAELLTVCWVGLGFLCSREFVCLTMYTFYVKCYVSENNTLLW
jgi:hypothetical protein